MKYLILLFFIAASCQSQNYQQMELTNSKLKEYKFLEGMYNDDYYPRNLVNKGRDILINLCHQIEKNKPQNLNELYKLTHEATNDFNRLDDELHENDSEIETMAREIIAMDFEFIAKSYGFEADLEELIATRDW